MRALQKLVRNGNSTQVTIPRTVLLWLGWLPGSEIIVETTENKHIVIRKPEENEFLPRHAVSVVLDGSFPVKP